MKDGNYTAEVQENFPKLTKDIVLAEVFVEKGELHITSTYELSEEDETKLKEFITWLDMKDIRLSAYDIHDILNIIQRYAEKITRDTEQTLEDEKAHKPLALFDNYTDFLAALYAQSQNAKRLMKIIQRQTGLRNI